MDISFYTAAVGAQMQQDRLNVHGDNIANINNYGFRARIPAFSSLMTGTVKSIDRDIQRGVGSKMEDSELDLRRTGFEETGRALDFAIDGPGFFGLLDISNNEISFTRDGSFIMSQQMVDEPGPDGQPVQREVWYLTDGNGRYVLGTDGSPIEVPPLASTRPTDSTGTRMDNYPIGVFDFINHNGMRSLSENRLIPVEKNGQVSLSNSKLVQGYLEHSNADLANEMTKVIESQRSFQYMLRMVSTSDEITTTVNNLR